LTNSGSSTHVTEGEREGVLLAVDGAELDVIVGLTDKELLGLKEWAVEGMELIAPDGLVDKELLLGREESVLVGIREEALLGEGVRCLVAELLGFNVGFDVGRKEYVSVGIIEEDLLGLEVVGGCSVVVNFQVSDTPSTNSSSETASNNISTSVPFLTLPDVTTYTCTVFE